MSDLEIFKLGISLALALKGDNEAIADVKLIYERHPEMFKNMEDLIITIKQTVENPDLIMKNYKNTSLKNEILAIKKVDNKVSDIAIKNDNGTNIIFHANKTNIRNFKRFAKKEVGGGDVHSLHISEQVCLGANNETLSGANALSPTDKPIIPQTLLNNLNTSKSINEFASV